MWPVTPSARCGRAARCCRGRHCAPADRAPALAIAAMAHGNRRAARADRQPGARILAPVRVKPHRRRLRRTRRCPRRCSAMTWTGGATSSGLRCPSGAWSEPADVAALAVHIMTNTALTGRDLRHSTAASNSSPECDLDGAGEVKEAETGERLPPGQVLTHKWPVLTYGETPARRSADVTFRCFGLVDQELSWTWEGIPRPAEVEDHVRHSLRDALEPVR